MMLLKREVHRDYSPADANAPQAAGPMQYNKSSAIACSRLRGAGGTFAEDTTPTAIGDIAVGADHGFAGISIKIYRVIAGMAVKILALQQIKKVFALRLRLLLCKR